jgi:hypothetical protein
MEGPFLSAKAFHEEEKLHGLLSGEFSLLQEGPSLKHPN